MDDEKKTLRDEFAMAALSGLIARAYSESDWEKLPIICYKLADAMLKARKV